MHALMMSMWAGRQTALHPSLPVQDVVLSFCGSTDRNEELACITDPIFETCFCDTELCNDPASGASSGGVGEGQAGTGTR